MSEKKFEVLSYSIANMYDSSLKLHTMHRIKALKSFDDVKVGDLGGWVESESNLSQEGNCWIYPSAVVGGKGYVKDDCKVLAGVEIYNSRRNKKLCSDNIIKPTQKSQSYELEKEDGDNIWENDIDKNAINAYYEYQNRDK